MSTIRRPPSIADDVLPTWRIDDARELYEIDRWGKGYFSIGPTGNVLVHPDKHPQRAIDLKQLVDRLRLRGVRLPLLIRFGGILEHRLRELHDAFARAICEHEYTGGYHCVYPIKVNQQRQVVEEVLEFGRRFGFGLEAGSKPELLAVIAMAASDTPIVCNGFKDDAYIETVMLAHKMGRNIIPVVERFTELPLILKYARRTGDRPQVGIRVKLAARGAGRWQGSAGYRSKFGLTASEVLEAIKLLRREGMLDCLKLMHFHMGSQVTNIRHIKEALNEAARYYVELKRTGAGLELLDVGGGLGVDYDGSQTNFESSVNYTLEEYANDVVFHVQRVCDEAGVEHPTIISESGRAVVAYHSVLVFNVLGVSQRDGQRAPTSASATPTSPIADLQEALENLTARNAQETFHDAQQSLDTALTLFHAGHLSLAERSESEQLYWAICNRLRRLVEQMDYVPEELQSLDGRLCDTYFCNFSLFQSIPDSWAIKQLFPIVPIHRLNERPTRRAVLADITCDSDGKIDQFIDLRDVKRALPVHEPRDEPYYLAAFLVGAYQEILGDLHNLFGDTNAVHVTMDDDGNVVFGQVVAGDTVREVLSFVQFDCDLLLRRFRAEVEAAVRARRIDDQQAGRLLQFYEDGLRSYTYLAEGGDSPEAP